MTCYSENKSYLISNQMEVKHANDLGRDSLTVDENFRLNFGPNLKTSREVRSDLTYLK